MSDGKTPHADRLFQAIRRDGVNALDDVNVTGRDGQNLLHTAIAYGNTPAALELIRRGINLNQQDTKGLTPLHLARVYGNAEAAEAILANGGDFSIVDMHGNSPVWTTVFNARGRYSVVDVLARHGAARVASTKNKHGVSPIDFANQIGDRHIVEILSR